MSNKQTVLRTKVAFDPAAERAKSVTASTQLIERKEVFEHGYSYCQLPAHFFDRALLVSRINSGNQMPRKSPVLSIESLDGRPVVSFYRA